MIRSSYSSGDLYYIVITKDNLKGWAKVGPSLGRLWSVG